MKGSELEEGKVYALKSGYIRDVQKAVLFRKSAKAQHFTLGVDRLDEIQGHDAIVGEIDACVVVRRFVEWPGHHVFKVEPREAAMSVSHFGGDKVPYTFEYATWASREIVAEWDDFERQKLEREEARARANEERQRRSEANEAKAEELRQRIAALGLEDALNVVTPRSGLAARHFDAPKLTVLDPDRLLEAIELRADVIAGGA